jgi:ribosome maturation protein SDO1
MVSVDKAFEMRYKFAGEEFQVLVDFDKLNEFKAQQEGSDQLVQMSDVLADDKIFKDQKKGEVASEDGLKKVFGDKSQEEILKEILLKGECQIPTAYLNDLRTKKKGQIINYIAEQAFNPQTKTKYTTTMIESAYDKIKFNVDPLKDFVYQAQEVLKLIKVQIPIAISHILLLIKVPGEHCGNFYGEFRKLGQVKKEFFDDHGEMHIHFQINEVDLNRVEQFIKEKANNEAEYHIKKD